MSFPSPITALKLQVSTGTDTYEQPISSASLGNNSLQMRNHLSNPFPAQPWEAIVCK